MFPEKMTLKDVALYLDCPLHDINLMVKKRTIPHFYHKNTLFFNKNEIRDWSSKSILERDKKNLFTKQSEKKEFLLHSFISQKQIKFTNVSSKLKILKEIANLAYELGLVTEEDIFLEQLIAREELQSTGLEDGIAIPHLRRQDYYLINEPFILIIKSYKKIPFKNIDDSLSDLFFVPCTSCEIEYLKMLSHLACLLANTSLKEELRHCQTEEECLQVFQEIEQEFNAK